MLLATAALAAAPVASASAATLPARPASEFRDSIGVQTHMPFTGFAYDRANTADLAAMLRAIGVRHLRDDTCFLKDDECVRVRSRLAALRDAFGSAGPPVDLVANFTRELAAVSDRPTRDADITRALNAAARPPLREMLAGLEPVNEPDLKESTNWAAATLADHATATRLLGSRQLATLRDVPLLSPAVGHAKNTPTLLNGGWNRGRADIGNFHPYPPVWGLPEQALDTACGSGNAVSCATSLGTAAAPWATESGYSTSGSPLSTNWVSERAQAIYIPRLLLENFRRGVARTYLYELIDLKPLGTGSAVDGYGLWRARMVGSNFLPGGPKPAALALSRMNEVIGDLGAGTAARTALDVSVRLGTAEVGDDEVRRVLLRSADGSYVLALWRPEKVWDNTYLDQGDIRVPDETATVTIGGGPWNATVTRPTLGAAPTARTTNATRLTLPLGADVTLVELHRVGGDNPGVGTPPATGGGTASPSRAQQAAAMQAAWVLLAALLAAAAAQNLR
jgi:hypothetical protein